MWGGALLSPAANLEADVGAVRSNYVRMSQPQPVQNPGKGTVFFGKWTKKDKNDHLLKNYTSTLYADRGYVDIPDADDPTRGKSWKVSTQDKWMWAQEPPVEDLTEVRRAVSRASRRRARRATPSASPRLQLPSRRRRRRVTDPLPSRVGGGFGGGPNVMWGGFINIPVAARSTPDEVRRMYFSEIDHEPPFPEPGDGTVDIKRHTVKNNDGGLWQNWESMLHAKRGQEDVDNHGHPEMYNVTEDEKWIFKQVPYRGPPRGRPAIPDRPPPSPPRSPRPPRSPPRSPPPPPSPPRTRAADLDVIMGVESKEDQELRAEPERVIAENWISFYYEPTGHGISVRFQPDEFPLLMEQFGTEPDPSYQPGYTEMAWSRKMHEMTAQMFAVFPERRDTTQNYNDFYDYNYEYNKVYEPLKQVVKRVFDEHVLPLIDEACTAVARIAVRAERGVAGNEAEITEKARRFKKDILKMVNVAYSRDAKRYLAGKTTALLPFSPPLGYSEWNSQLTRFTKKLDELRDSGGLMQLRIDAGNVAKSQMPSLADWRKDGRTDREYERLVLQGTDEYFDRFLREKLE